MIFVSEEDYRGDDIGVIQDEFLIEICKPKKGVDSFNGQGGLPVLNGG